MDLYALECMRQSSECFPPNGLTIGLTQLVKLVTDVMFRRFSIDNTIFCVLYHTYAMLQMSRVYKRSN